MPKKASPNISNELKDVISTIQGYEGLSSCKDTFAALAQEPVQNAKDNPMSSGKKIPTITYELIENDENTMLIITDENTTGLDGEVQTPDDIFKKLSAGEVDKISNHSAFFADNITTKEKRDSSGSRGQGKKAALYHGRFSVNDQERILMIVDTNTRDENNKNTYRTSFMYFTPRRNHLGPFLNKEGKELLKEIDFSEYVTETGEEPLTEFGLKDNLLKLDLKPLARHGTRLIIPYLNEETVEKFKDGTMVKWFERIWWNAIQEDKVKIVLKMDGDSKQIRCLDFWSDKPYENKKIISESTKDKGVFVRENIEVAGTSDVSKRVLGKSAVLKIKRIVLDWDIDREEDEIIKGKNKQELSGVQWIRNNQWITTESVSHLTANLIGNIEDKEKFRKGFRGFIEFDDETCRVLKDDSIETPQHHDINRNVDIDKILKVLDDTILECATIHGWTDEIEDASKDRSNAMDDFLDLGVWGFAGKDSPKKTLDAKILFETESNSNLVKWNDQLKNISVSLSSLNSKSLKETIYPKNRRKPLRAPGTTDGSVWEPVEQKLAMILYKLKGLNVRNSDPLFKKLQEFTGRSTNSIKMKLGNYDSIANPEDPGLKNYQKSMDEVYEEFINVDDTVLLEKFDNLIEAEQKNINVVENLECELTLKKPDNTLVSLGKSKADFDLSEEMIIEDSFKTIDVDKNTHFDLKRKYELIATWFDGYKIEVAKATRTFFVQEKDDIPEPPPFSLITNFINLTTGEETDSYSYGDKIEIQISIRNRTEKELIFHAISSLDSNQLLESDFKSTVPPKNTSYEFEDFPLYTFQSEIQPEVLDQKKADEIIALSKGKVEFRVDIYEITELGGEVPSLERLISNEFVLNENHRFSRKNLFIEVTGTGDKYFERAIVPQNSGNGKHFWEFADKNYVNDPLPILNIYELHPTRRAAKLNKDTTNNSFTERDFDNLIHAEGTVNILIERHLFGGDENSEINRFIENAKQINTTDTKAHYLYSDNLEILKDIENEKDYRLINQVKTTLISSLYSMSMSSYKNFN